MSALCAAEAERAVMPGMVAPEPLSAEEALLYGLIAARLRHVRTDPGRGDRRFIWDIVRVSPNDMSEAQRAHLMRLAWRYRWQMPPMLRPARDPDQSAQNEAN